MQCTFFTNYNVWQENSKKTLSVDFKLVILSFLTFHLKKKLNI